MEYDPEASQSLNASRMYIDLLKRIVINTIYQDIPIDPWSGGSYQHSVRRSGRDWPAVAMTMIGEVRLDNIHQCIDNILKDGIEGDFIETGVWRGGACIFMRGVLRAYGNTKIKVFAADSFAGLPLPDPKYEADIGDIHHRFSELAVSLEDVKSNFEKFNLLDSQVVFLEGWFKDTLPTVCADKFSLLRLDGDMYESTIVALDSLYCKLSPGGYVIIDDYGAVPACKLAVTDYRRDHNISDPIQDIDGLGAFWRKS